MIVLGIETSCDETGIAILEVNKSIRILAEEVSSQVEIHESYGGVVPELAAREHLRNIPIVLDSVLGSAGVTLDKIEVIAVTMGPGLKGCLLIGVNFAKAISLANGTPLVGVNHIEGHLLAPFLENPELKFPYLGLIVSGGHTEIVEVRGYGKYTILCRTMDDAAGEAFDKSANLLGFTYPGGPKLAALADTVSSSEFKLPKVMREGRDFSFSGLKTAISLLVQRENSRLSRHEVKASLCYAVQASIIDALIFKLRVAIQETGINTVCVSGGVAANLSLRQQVSGIRGIKAAFPSALHSTDNGAMIAYAGAQRYILGDRLDRSSGVMPRWPVEQISRYE